jgi:DHA2 family multidrug resistance protein
VLLPLWLQQFMGYTATSAGMALAPVGLFAIILSPLVGRNVSRIDSRLFATASFFVFALVLWMRSRFTPLSDLWTILLPTLVQGVAMAFFFIPLMNIVLSGLPPHRIAAASGLSNFARITAGAFGTSIATTLWDNRATLHHAHLVEQVGNAGSLPLAETTRQLSAGGFSGEQISGLINNLINVQAYTRAADDVFAGSAALFIVLIGLEWFTKPMRAGAAPGDAAAAH